MVLPGSPYRLKSVRTGAGAGAAGLATGASATGAAAGVEFPTASAMLARARMVDQVVALRI